MANPHLSTRLPRDSDVQKWAVTVFRRIRRSGNRWPASGGYWLEASAGLGLNRAFVRTHVVPKCGGNGVCTVTAVLAMAMQKTSMFVAGRCDGIDLLGLLAVPCLALPCLAFLGLALAGLIGLIVIRSTAAPLCVPGSMRPG